MIDKFKTGDLKAYSHIVTESDIARFEHGEVHNVYSTFALARDAEWSGRLFVLEMKDSDEEGIGSGIEIKHISPALIGQTVRFEASFVCLHKNEVINDFNAYVGDRLIAKGRQWQKIIKKERLEALFAGIEN
jgi:predicted thioesterase